MTGRIITRLARFPARFLNRIKPKSRATARDLADDPAIAVPLGWKVAAPDDVRVAVMIHMFYEDMAEIFRDLLGNIETPCDVLITTDLASKQTQIERVFADWRLGKVVVRLVPNQGRDIAPKLTAFRDDYASYDIVLFLHSKKTERDDVGTQWRNELFTQLCGSREVVRSILYLFASDPELGLVFCRHFPAIRPYLDWRNNEACGQRIAQKLGLCLDVDGLLDFPSGSVFWARPAALKPLLDLGLDAQDFPAEAGQLRGTIAHAIERLFLVVCEQAGFTWCKIGMRKFVVEGERLMDADSPEALERIRKLVQFQVSPTMISCKPN